MTTKNRKPAAKTQTELSTESRKLAAASLRPSVNAAVVIGAFAKPTFGELELVDLVDSLAETMTQINGGNLVRVENMLYGQASALQSIFVNLTRQAANQEYLKQHETYLRLALKAQSQCRATLETLAAIKNPPVVFARQANIASGHQQINNGTAASSHAEEIESEPSKLSGANHELLPNAGASGLASRVNPDVATVETLNRAKVTRR